MSAVAIPRQSVTSTTDIESTDFFAAGTWRQTNKSVWLTCPNGHSDVLDDHTIADDGTVTPSVVCPYDGCDWHVHVRLEGWSP